MIAELGLYFLCLALGAIVLQTLYALSNLNTAQPPNLIIWLTRGTVAYTACFLSSFLCLATLFLNDDFSVHYVAEHSNTLLPAPYKIAAIWGAHEGSLLLWLVIMAGWNTLFITTAKKWPRELFMRTLIILNVITIGFLVFTLFTSHPFTRNLGIIPTEGRDLNPLLQDPGLVSHPPMLYMGYVGTAINYAIALAILWLGKYPTEFARLMRPWALGCFCFLTLGIVLGSLWAYRELGWGGFWFWDPVENASFIPWLMSTALIHSLMVTEKRGLFKNWSLLLCIILFALSLLGTFLVRSGVVTSVHAFANDPARGIFLLALLAMVLLVALSVYAVRATKFLSVQPFNFWCKESFLLMNNVVLVIAAATILFGTMYPMILDSLHLEKLSVGPSYFNTVFTPLVFSLMLLMGIGPLCYWQRTSTAQLKKIFYTNFFAALLGLIFLVCVIEIRLLSLSFILAIITSLWLISGTLHFVSAHFKRAGKHSIVNGFQFLGITCAHLGLAVTVIGVACSSYFSQAREVKLSPGDHINVAGYTFTLMKLANAEGPNYSADTATFNILSTKTTGQSLTAEKRYYHASHMAMTETAIIPTLTQDLYVAMGEKITENSWSFRIYVKPMIRLIWLGGLMMFLGGFCALFIKRNKE